VLTPGILFRVSKVYTISAIIHAIIFSGIFTLFISNSVLEGMDEDTESTKVFLDASCNNILGDSDEPPENAPLFLIQNSKCINMNDYEE